MGMKVSFFNHKLLNEISAKSAVLSTIVSFIMILEISQTCRLSLFILVIFIVLLIYSFSLRAANNKKVLEEKINDTEIVVKYGDIFEQQGIKVIAFNEFFDTLVDDKIISKTTLNGIFIEQYSKGKEELDQAIANENRLSVNLIRDNVERKYGGKNKQYKLGSICPVDEYFLLAFSHFDQDNKAYLTVEDYISCLMHMWNELDRFYAGKSISIPLLGSGITRFNDIRIKPQELLEYMLITYKASMVNLKNIKVTFVLDKSLTDKIDLYNIRW